ncbi:MAG TPA: bifunctional glutamate N-acetyltransferase/amino-acid acetyltransferase ArgJ [Verrucomicrobia bacterium]|nr:bifunctional glutamate N-acetyltransferase/amino-acid acetyltransferase ArgJ [Verrucomicrobiota bacterium]HOB31939.1 bifunctional glutamate N-acetyltransferase/amino-acid acetyltransferase ArgJ [Verrucomicrobiota bacterium]HOP97702.1 bifunctional glutamate N-acetyltransferase/amino-acid acetyltransferase ArgJ [Verrucomicrobiota bacterium]
MKSFKVVPGSIVAPKGFRTSGVFCDIKRLGTGKGSAKGRKRDLALIVSDVDAVAAGMFTTNQVCAAPVKLCLERLHRSRSRARAIVVNSGNANACTGPQGMADAREMAAFTERALNVPKGSVLVGSTGRIGVLLPMDNVRAGIVDAAVHLGATREHAANAAEAIMTSDTKPKQLALEFSLGGRTVRLGGICKGAGMIQPGMSLDGRRPAALHATMLCFLTTDAAISPPLLRKALEEAVAQSFNRITVDGDMSTNDTVLILANGLAGNPLLRVRDSRFTIFQSALNRVCLELAQMIVQDGEGVSRFVTVRVAGARSTREADLAARAVANSALVKTSWHGGDPNWGRIMDALGYSPARVVEEKVDIGYSAPGARRVLWSVRRGQPTPVPFKELCAAVAPKEFDLHINLNLGRATAVIYAADLTEAYVDFNKGDISDPASLGG